MLLSERLTPGPCSTLSFSHCYGFNVCACKHCNDCVHNICNIPNGEVVSTTMVGVDGLFGGDFMDAALWRPKLPPMEKEAGCGCSPTSLIVGKPCNERLKKLLLDWVDVGDCGGEGDRVQCSELPDSCSCCSNSSSDEMKGSSFGRFTVNSTLVGRKKRKWLLYTYCSLSRLL